MKKTFAIFLTILISINIATCQTPAITMTTSYAIGSTISFDIITSAVSNINVDFGDGTLVSKTINNSLTTVSGTIVGSQTVKIYGSGITAFDCSDMQLTALDVTQNAALFYLACFENQISTLDVTKNTILKDLYCFKNQLTTLDVTKNTVLKEFECYSNKLSTLDVSQNTALTLLWCDNNQLSALDITKNTILTNLTCSNNQLTFKTLPLKQTNLITYGYTPQQPIPIVKTLSSGTNLDLSTQLTINGNTTVYTWKTKGGTTLVKGTDYTLTNGITVFLKAPSDSVYCEMTNTTFPNFTGSDVLKTTNVKVTGTTDIEDIKTSEPEIYNHNKTLYINLTYNGQCSVFNNNGRLIISKPIYEGSNSMQLPNSGLYLVKISGNKDIVTKKVIVE